MSAESNNMFAAAKAASHVRFFLTQAEDGDRPEGYGAAGLVDNPDARPVATVGDRRIGNHQRARRTRHWQPDRHCGPQGGVRIFSFKDVASFEGSRRGVGGIGELPQASRSALDGSIQRSMRYRPENWTHG